MLVFSHLWFSIEKVVKNTNRSLSQNNIDSSIIISFREFFDRLNAAHNRLVKAA
jgi:hypothetical protein